MHYADALDNHWLRWHVVIAADALRLNAGNLLHDFHAFDDFAENRILHVKISLRTVANEELACRAVWIIRARHRDCAVGVLDVPADFQFDRRIR